MKELFMKAAYMLSESEIRYAMENTCSNREASVFLKVNYLTYMKYAKLYYDAASGKTLWEVHKNQSGKRTIKKQSNSLARVQDIFVGSHPNYPIYKLKERLIQEGVFGDQCNICSYHSLRRTDLQSPTVLAFKNQNDRDRRKENMEIVCLNCYFLYYGNLVPKKDRLKHERPMADIAPSDTQENKQPEYHGIRVQRATGFEY